MNSFDFCKSNNDVSEKTEPTSPLLSEIYPYLIRELEKLLHISDDDSKPIQPSNSKFDYSFFVRQTTHEVDQYIVEIRSKNGLTQVKKSAAEISKDKELLSKLNPMEANRIGYLAGVQETVKEFKSRRNKNKKSCDC